MNLEVDIIAKYVERLLGPRAGGLDVDSLKVKPPTRFDFMGYCDPDWVS